MTSAGCPPSTRHLGATTANQILFTGVLSTQGAAFNPWVAVFDFQSISVAAGARISAVGDKPLALLSRSTWLMAGTLDASGQIGGNQAAGTGGADGPGGGAGGAGSAFQGQGQPGAGPGGGPGGYDGLGNGSWGAGGAYGGQGSGLNPALTPALAYGDLPHRLLAGSGGGGTGANLFGSGAGAGNLASVTVGAAACGDPGVITFGARQPVPEPAQWALLLVGGLCWLGKSRRRA